MAASLCVLTPASRFMAKSWNTPQTLSTQDQQKLRQRYNSELERLLVALPDRFKPAIRLCLDGLDDVFSLLPIVLHHRDFRAPNILVDERSCHITAVVDWGEAEIGPFGFNLHFVEPFMARLHPEGGWKRFEDYPALHKTFWATFRDNFQGEWVEGIKKAIYTSTVLGLLLVKGFTTRLPTLPPPVPIQEDAANTWNMMFLDAFLVDPSTKLLEL